MRAGHGTGIQVITPDHDRRRQLAGGDHLIERQPEPVPVAQSHPADARRQALEFDALRRHVEPVVQVPIVGQQLFHLGVGALDIARVTRQRRPAKRANAAAE